MFDTEAFLDECRGVVAESDEKGAIREVLDRAVARSSEMADALQPERAGITLMHHAPDLTVLHVVWAPGMQLFPHNHEMWAAIAIYSGVEDNAFFRRSGPGEKTLVESGGKRLDERDVVLLGRETIHSVANPGERLTGAIHVYGGDFVNQPRSQWGPAELEERPYNYEETLQTFADANEAWLGTN